MRWIAAGLLVVLAAGCTRASEEPALPEAGPEHRLLAVAQEARSELGVQLSELERELEQMEIRATADSAAALLERVQELRAEAMLVRQTLPDLATASVEVYRRVQRDVNTRLSRLEGELVLLQLSGMPAGETLERMLRELASEAARDMEILETMVREAPEALRPSYERQLQLLRAREQAAQVALGTPAPAPPAGGAPTPAPAQAPARTPAAGSAATTPMAAVRSVAEWHANVRAALRHLRYATPVATG